MIELKPYRPALRGDLMGLWNRTFAERRLFRPLDRDTFRRRIEAPVGRTIDPRFLQVATDGERVVGFAHGGIWDETIGAELLPDRVPPGPVGYLAMVVVAAEARRRGVGHRLVDAVTAVVRTVGGADTPFIADGRMFNPHYGNFLAPVPPLWGTTEGVSVPQEDEDTRAFLHAMGFDEQTQAWSLRVEPARVERGAPPPGAPELVITADYLPELGTAEGSAFAVPNASRTWLLVEAEVQVGYLVAYPLGAEPAGPWGIYALELDAVVRGRGVGRWLVAHALAELGAIGVPSVETLVLPLEAPEALRLYQRLGFVKEAAWVIFQ